jgi:hypothetical protein
MGRCRKCGFIVDDGSEVCAHCAAQSRLVPAAWKAPVGLAAAFIVLNLVGVAMIVNFRWRLPVVWMRVAIALIGALLAAEPVVIAIWAALGPPPAFRRILWNAAAAVAAVYAVAAPLSSDAGPPAENVVAISVIFLGVFLILALLLLLVRRFSGWQIEHATAQFHDRNPAASQFRIKDLLATAMLLAIALGVGRCLWPPGRIELRDAPRMAFMLPIAAAFCAAVLLPVASAFGMFLARHCGERRLIAPLAAIWGIVDLILVLLAIYFGRPGLVDFFVAFVWFRLGSLLLSLPSAAALYYGGYRLVRHDRDAKTSLDSRIA